MKTRGISCVYKITYTGNKLPPYYIGSCYFSNLERGYLGSVSSVRWGEKWGEESKENPHLFKVEILSFHDSREEALFVETIEQENHFKLGNPLWVNQSYARGKFLTTSESASKSNITARERKSRDYLAITRKGFETRIKNGKATSWTTESTLRGMETKRARGVSLGGNVESAQRGIATKRSTGAFIIAGNKVSIDAKNKARRKNVIELKELLSRLNIKLMSGWYKKPDEWIDQKITDLSKNLT